MLNYNPAYIHSMVDASNIYHCQACKQSAHLILNDGCWGSGSRGSPSRVEWEGMFTLAFHFYLRARVTSSEPPRKVPAIMLFVCEGISSPRELKRGCLPDANGGEGPIGTSHTSRHHSNLCRLGARDTISCLVWGIGAPSAAEQAGSDHGGIRQTTTCRRRRLYGDPAPLDGNQARGGSCGRS
uniref:Uncharacterized protein n=1 Tax=Setaria viridis TaxID=4556 RepID=A0A4U6VSX0_SETVI|nr:hypothetical protein SEVIR_3G282400v2 [Setaria viridis]